MPANIRLILLFLMPTLIMWNYDSKGQPLQEESVWISDEYGMEYRPASVFRDTFKVSSLEGRAVFKIASLGIHEITINGQRVGEVFLNPVFTNFSKRVFENTYDVTDFLKVDGINTITVTLGNGFYNFQPVNNWRFDLAAWRGRPSFQGSLFDEHSGDVFTKSDETWFYQDSPWTFNAIYLGETYDQRKVISSIHDPLLNTESWSRAKVLPTPDIIIDPQPPVDIKITEVLQPVSINQVDRFRAVYAFDRNIAGVVEIAIPPLRKGQVVSLHYGEQLDQLGGVDNGNLSIAYKEKVPGEDFQTDRLISNGRDTLRFTNRFSYKGFQFVEIKSARPLDYSAIQVKAYALSSIAPISSLITGNEILNELWSVANRSISANMIGLPTDCPTREKNGWTGDGHLIFGSSAYNFDMNALYRKWALDHQDAQLTNGLIPNIVPTAGYGVERNFFDWTVSAVFVPWSHYLYYGDISVLTENYEMMQSFMSYWRDKTRNHLLSHGIGDWKAEVNSSTWFTTSTLYLDALRKMSQIAEMLNRTRDQRTYQEEAQKVLKIVQRHFYDSESGVYANGTQTELAYALYYELAPDVETTIQLSEALINVLEENSYRVDVGVIGTLPLLGALKQMGRSDIALRLVTNPENEIWAGWLKGESKTLYEGRGYSPDNRYGGSQNHMYFGTYNEWIASDVVGLRPVFEDPAFQKVRLEPSFIEELGFIDWNYRREEGDFRVAWQFLNENEVKLEVELPSYKDIFFRIPEGFRIQQVWPSDLLERTLVSRDALMFQASSFTIQFERTRGELTLHNESNGLYFDGKSIYPDLQIVHDASWEFEVYDLTGKMIYRKRLEYFAERVPILSVTELPSGSKGMLLGRLINVHSGEIQTSINFIK